MRNGILMLAYISPVFQITSPLFCFRISGRTERLIRCVLTTLILFSLAICSGVYASRGQKVM